MDLRLSDIRMDGGTQPRETLSEDLIQEYAEAMAAGRVFPPITVYNDGESYWLADGFHRTRAAERSGRADINVEIVQGTQRDAVLFSVGANAKHGLRRNHADVECAIKRLLLDSEWVTWSDRWLAEIIRCDDQTVGRHRETLEATAVIPQLDKLLGKDGKWRQRNGARAKPAPPEVVTLEQWKGMTEKARKSALATPAADSTFNEQENDSIEWAQWSWNPITGCLHGCAYCYARDIAERFYPHGFVPVLHPRRIGMPRKMRVPEKAQHDIGYRNVFTCSMADLFGKWVPEEWIRAVLAEVERATAWNFLFLTKFPQRLSEFDFPENAWVGTTVDRQSAVERAEKAFSKVRATVKWLSVEPLLEPLQFSKLDLFNWMVIGGSSRSTQTPEWRPPRPWIARLELDAWDNGLKVYEKGNLYEEHMRIRDYPGALEVKQPDRAPDALFKTS